MYIKKLWPFIRPNVKTGLVAAISLVLATLLALPTPLFVKYVIDQVILKKKIDQLLFVIILLVIIILAEAITKYINQLYFYRFEQEVIIDIQTSLIQKVLRFPKSFFEKKQIGYLMARLNGDIFRLRDLFSKTIVGIATNVFKFLAGAVILFFLHWKLALASLAIMPFFYLSVSKLGRKSRQKSHDVMEKSAHVSRDLQESLSGVTLIKSYRGEANALQRIFQSMKGSLQAGVERNKISAFSQLMITLIASSGTIIVLWFGAKEIIMDRMTLGSFVAFNSYLGYLYGPSRFLASSVVQLQAAFAAFDRVFELFGLVPEDENDGGKRVLEKLRGEIQFEGICYSYENRQDVLSDIDFSIKPGEKIAIVGPTGAGKSTLIKLLMRFYNPSRGKILFDGIEAETISLKSIRERIGLVSQDTFLFNDTVMNNIKYGSFDATEEAVMSAARASGVLEFVESFPEGYRTLVGERGDNLSVGQKQRISIARAFLKNPDILIFDEPTSALDAITETAVKDAIFRHSKEKTVFIIAHRLSTVTSADRIFVLEKGRIIQVGGHEELVREEGLYRNMFGEQTSHLMESRRDLTKRVILENA